MADVAKLEAALLKAHRAGDARSAQAIADEIKRVRSAAPTAPPQQNGRAASFGAGFFSGVSDVSNTIVSAAANLVDRTGISPAGAVAWAAKNVGGYSDADSAKIARNLSSLPNFQTVVNAGANANRQRTAANNQAYPNWFAGGQIAGQTFATAPVAAGAGAAISRLGAAAATKAPVIGRVLQNVGAATKTGGIGSGRTAAQTAAMTRTARGAALAERAAGGAIAGGATAAAAGQDPVTGAEFGAALPIVAAPVRKIAGGIVDAFRSDKVRAAKVFRDALGTNIDAARAAFASLAPDDQRLARKVLVDEGVEPDTFMALGADVERLRPEQVRLNQEAETAAARRGLETAAGVGPGGSATDVRAAVRGGRQAVSEEMSPAREAAFENIAGVNRAVSDAETLAQSARARAAEQSGLARRMAFGADRAETRLGQMDDLGDQFNPAAINAARGQAGAMGARAEAAAQEAIAQRGVATDMEDFIHQAAAADVGPQRGAPLVSALRSMAGQRGTRMDDLQRNTILRVAKKIESAMDENGMIDPYDMYQLRKTGVSDIIEGLQKKITAGTEPRSGNVQRAEQLAGSVRTMIDDTLGPEFKDYLARSAQGYQAVNRQELAGEALKRFNAPGTAGYLGLVSGEEPKTVANIMKGGPDLENIANAFAADPARWAALTEGANLLQGRNRMNELASSGVVAAGELMKQTPPSWLRPFTRMALAKVPAGRIAAEGAGQLAGDLMDQNVRKRLAESFMSGQNANNLLNTYSTGVLTDAQISMLAPYQRNLLAQSLRGYFTSPDQNAGY